MPQCSFDLGLLVSKAGCVSPVSQGMRFHGKMDEGCLFCAASALCELARDQKVGMVCSFILPSLF